MILRYTSLLLTLLLVRTLSLQGQELHDFKEYKGEVLDADTKKPLVFASLMVQGHNLSTVTNSDGGFTLKVPDSFGNAAVVISFLGYQSKTLLLENLDQNNNKIYLEVSVTELAAVDISVPKDAAKLVEETLRKRGANYFMDPTVMTAFYRETIKKRRKNVSLSEAVVNIYKTPYTSSRRDAVKLYKARKSTDYSKLDTLVLKLQGGPFNALFVDIVKYPQYVFDEYDLSHYNFSFDRSTRINDQLIYVVDFVQREDIVTPLYKGKLFIDAEKKILTSAIYSLNITDRREASRMFVRKKPVGAEVWPTEVSYRVDYREKNGLWYYGYSNVLMEFKIDWDKRLFNSVYSMNCEMAVTNWERNPEGTMPKGRDQIRSSIIMMDESIGFSDPDFWGEFNIIEPDKSIESAIKKIQRQLKRSGDDGAAK